MDDTLNERKSRMPQIWDIKDEAVVVYCESLITKKMGCHRLSPWGKRNGIFSNVYISFVEEIRKYI